MMEWHHAERASDQPERVDIGLVRIAPAVERNAELVGAASGGKKLRLVDP